MFGNIPPTTELTEATNEHLLDELMPARKSITPRFQPSKQRRFTSGTKEEGSSLERPTSDEKRAMTFPGAFIDEDD